MDENISIHRNSLFIRTMDLIEQATLLASMGCDNESCFNCPFFNEMENGETCILRKIKNLNDTAYRNVLPPAPEEITIL
jgi:hypothetical protein